MNLGLISYQQTRSFWDGASAWSLIWKTREAGDQSCDPGLVVQHVIHYTTITPANILSTGINRIFHHSQMQTEKSQLQGKWIMPETRLTEFPALSVDPRVGISLGDLCLIFFLPMTLKIIKYHLSVHLFMTLYVTLQSSAKHHFLW